jgi:hypothetical protein
MMLCTTVFGPLQAPKIVMAKIIINARSFFTYFRERKEPSELKVHGVDRVK